tara:strand:- start:221 stop:445 length:225 start_codon:yes stop_codon:yes gene_type:complete
MTKKLFIPANINATNSELDAKKIITNKDKVYPQVDNIPEQVYNDWLYNKDDNKEKSNNEKSDYCEGEFIPNFHD